MLPSKWEWHVPEPGLMLAGSKHLSNQCLSHPHLAGNCLTGCELDHDPTLASAQLSLPGLSDSREINVLRPVVYVTG